MNEEKKSFIIYTDIIENILDLSDAEAGILFKGLLKYSDTGIEQTFEDRLVKHNYMTIRRQMNRDFEKWKGIKEARSRAGKLGGAKKGNQNAKKDKTLQDDNTSVIKNKQNKQSQAKQTKQAVNVNVNDNVNVNVNDNVIQLADGLLRPLEKAANTSYEQDLEEIYKLVAIKLDEGHTEDELKQVVEFQCKELEKVADKDRGNMEMFSNPLFLFGSAYESTLSLMNKQDELQDKMQMLKEQEEAS